MKKIFSFVVLNCNPYLYRKIKSTFFKPHISSLPDEELLARYNRTGDTKYFGELYNRYIPLLYGVCLKYLGNAEKAEDAVMQLFEELTEKIGRYEITLFRTWLYSVVKNHCFQLLRKEEREIPVNFDADFMESADIVHLLSDDDEDSRLRRCEMYEAVTSAAARMHRIVLYARTVVCRYCKSDRLFFEPCKELYPEWEKKLENLYLKTG